MLESFKRWFSRLGEDRDLTDLTNVADWAKRCGHDFRRARGDEGFVIDGRLDGKPWRIEWGPPQRAYIVGKELRIRMELDLPSDAQMLLLSRPLMEALERQTFEEFTDNVQTQIGTKTPEEMRWLVMFPKVNLGGLKTVRRHFSAVASQPDMGLSWISGALAGVLEQAAAGMLSAEPPFVLMTLRGRAYLRMQLAAPDAGVVDDALSLFETAVTQALRLVGDKASAASGWQAVATTEWQSLHPGELPEPPPRA